MRKTSILLFSVFIALLCISAFIIINTCRINEAVKGGYKAITYKNVLLRNENKRVMAYLLKKDAIAVLGSSELGSSDTVAYPPYLFDGGNSNFNTILIGGSHNQSLFHALLAGAYSDIIPNKKLVFIISPQWFTKEGNPPEAFASRFSEPLFIDFMKNTEIPLELRRIVADKVFESLSTDKKEQNRVSEINSIYLDKDATLFKFFLEKVYQNFLIFKQNYLLARLIKEQSISNSEKSMVDVNFINFNKLYEKAISVAKKESDNNDFCINNSYYSTYVERELKNKKNSALQNSYLESPEYDDFELFLKVCCCCGISPLIISVPVHGMWYDWCGFPKQGRKQYYEKIRNICGKYDVSVADFSDKEYEPYFLKDVMHVGWKGWVYLDEAIYNFYKK